MIGLTSKKPEAGSNFYPAFFFLSGSQRKALSAVYAYCRHVDDIVDVPSRRSTEDSIAFWRKELGLLYKGNPTCDISKRLLPAVAKYGLEQEAFLLILEGVEKDLSVFRYETFAELEEYMLRVAAAVGFLCVKIFGYDHPSAREYAKQLGYAVQLTNILRDISSDADMGRIYIPLEDMRRFKCREYDIKDSMRSLCFRELMCFEAGRARQFYEKARQTLPPEYKNKMRPAGIMSAIYEGLLSKIEKSGFDVYKTRISLGAVEKMICVIKACR